MMKSMKRWWHRILRYWDGVCALAEKTTVALRQLLGFGRGARPWVRPKRQPYRLSMEQLEVRTMPSMSPFPKCLPFRPLNPVREFPPPRQRAVPAEREDVCRKRTYLDGVPKGAQSRIMPRREWRAAWRDRPLAVRLRAA